MAVMKTHISWADSTWNPTVGCTKVSAGCDHCYAEAFVTRLGRHKFTDLQIYPDRLNQVDGFQPIDVDAHHRRPRKVFVNSMSDLLHVNIPMRFKRECFSAMDRHPETVFIVLTKRPVQLKQLLRDHYPTAVPNHIWLGVSVEDNNVAKRLDLLRKMKDRWNFIAMVSIEPLIGPVGQLDLTDIDGAYIGGESPQLGKSRPMDLAWATDARDRCRAARTAVWFKQFGTWGNNPLYRKTEGKTHVERVAKAIAAGEQLAYLTPDRKTGKIKVTGEKGGATLHGEVLREDPAIYDELKDRLNKSRLV